MCKSFAHLRKHSPRSLQNEAFHSLVTAVLKRGTESTDIEHKNSSFVTISVFRSFVENMKIPEARPRPICFQLTGAWCHWTGRKNPLATRAFHPLIVTCQDLCMSTPPPPKEGLLLTFLIRICGKMKIREVTKPFCLRNEVSRNCRSGQVLERGTHIGVTVRDHRCLSLYRRYFFGRVVNTGIAAPICIIFKPSLWLHRHKLLVQTAHSHIHHVPNRQRFYCQWHPYLHPRRGSVREGNRRAYWSIGSPRVLLPTHLPWIGLHQAHRRWQLR